MPDDSTPKKPAKVKPETEPEKRRSVNLSMSESAWKRGSHYAIEVGVSLSALVERYFMTLPDLIHKPAPKKPKKKE